VAANNTGVRRLGALLDRQKAETVAHYIDELIAYTERRTRAEVAKLPKGVYTADGYVDNDGFTDEPVHLVAKVVIDDNGVVFDLTGSDAQRRAPVNSTHAQTYSGCAFVLKSLIDPDVPVNAGFYSQVRMNAPVGSVVNCAPPGPVVGGWETQQRVTDVILKALASATTASWRPWQGDSGGVPRATAPMPCRPTARTPRTPRSRRQNSTIRFA
jgi:N-methylhydantoinase B